jgi:hypothetical protein
MKRKLFTAFLSGVCVSGLAFGYVLQHTDRLVQGAWVAREDQTSSTIRFYHDATDNVICVKVPIPDFPTTKGRHSGVATTTVKIWEEADGFTENLMMTDAYEVQKMELLDLETWKKLW